MFLRIYPFISEYMISKNSSLFENKVSDPLFFFYLKLVAALLLKSDIS